MYLLYHLFENGVALQLDKFEFLLPRKALCHVWLILAQLLCIGEDLFCIYLLLEKGMILNCLKHTNPFTEWSSVSCQI